jgi:hypothetical protein
VHVRPGKENPGLPDAQSCRPQGHVEADGWQPPPGQHAYPGLQAVSNWVSQHVHPISAQKRPSLGALIVAGQHCSLTVLQNWPSQHVRSFDAQLGESPPNPGQHCSSPPQATPPQFAAASSPASSPAVDEPVVAPVVAPVVLRA